MGSGSDSSRRLGLGLVKGGATVSTCLRGQALFQHTASVWSPVDHPGGMGEIECRRHLAQQRHGTGPQWLGTIEECAKPLPGDLLVHHIR